MKTRLLVPFIFSVLLTSSASFAQKENELKIPEGLTATVAPYEWRCLGTLSAFVMTMTIHNATPDTVIYKVWWPCNQSRFLTNTSAYEITFTDLCVRNEPRIARIPPGMSCDMAVAIKPANMDFSLEKNRNAKLRIGMRFITSGEQSEENAPIVWSEEFELKRFYEKRYQVLEK